jgi:hypothetical protein
MLASASSFVVLPMAKMWVRFAVHMVFGRTWLSPKLEPAVQLVTIGQRLVQEWLNPKL